MSRIVVCAFASVFTSITTLVWWAKLFTGIMHPSWLNCAAALVLVVSMATCWSIFMDLLKEFLNE